MKRSICITFLFALFWALPAGRASIETGGHDNEQIHSQHAVNIRQLFRLPKMLDFDYFKQSFDKHYGSVVEELLRRKLYLGRAFRAFISTVCYKYQKASSYLAINFMSDWTPKEVEDLYMKATDGDSIKQQPMPTRPANFIPEVSIEDLEKELAEIESLKDEEGYKEIYEELRNDLEKEKNKQNNLDVHPESVDSMDNKSAPGSIVELDEANNVVESTGGSLGISFLRYVITTAIESIKNQDGNPASTNRRVQPNVERGLLQRDYRKSDCYSPPKNQGRCGSCYAFATVALYEFLFCQATGVKTSFSEQYVVDCGDKVQLRGCKGGKFVRVSAFSQQFGLELQQTYPYVGKQNQCPYNDDDPQDKRGYLRIEDNNFGAFPSERFDVLLNRSPFIVNILINREFNEYGGGVDRMIGCWSGDLLFHSAVVVGSGIEDGEDFWLIRNSFGTDWGENGHYKLDKQSGCINFNEGYIPKVVFKEKYEDNLNPKYDLETLASRIKQHQSTWNKLKRAGNGLF